MGNLFFSIRGFAAHREKSNPYFSSDEDFLNPPSKNGKVLKKSDIKALLVQINNALKSECKSECDPIYQDPKEVHQ